MILAYVRVVILLVVLWSFDISSRKSIYGSSVCNGVVWIVNIVSVWQFAIKDGKNGDIKEILIVL